jgi:hypothetical protein
MAAVERKPVVQPERFPFDAEFQKSLVRLLCEDDEFAHAVSKFLIPQYFESEVLAWAYTQIHRHREQYNCSPSVNVLLNQTVGLDGKIRPIYEMAIQEVGRADLGDEGWLRDKVLDFVKRTMFAKSMHECISLYNTGKLTEAYDVWQERSEAVNRVMWEPVDESRFFDDLAKRQARRMQDMAQAGAVPTGFPFLDHVLDGGLSPGEMGIWIAYPKKGKSTLLMNLGRYGVTVGMRPVMHFVLEGSRQMVENRYDAAFMDEFYSKVKTGDVDDKKYTEAWRQYQILKGKLLIRGFTDRFDYSILDIEEALRDAKRRHNFQPDMLVVDYGDLLGGRDTKRGYKSETEKQKSAFRDLKVLSSRGYALWTASQAQRPKEGAEEKAEWLYSRSIADCYEKVRVADFLGSLNQTHAEREANTMRLFAELYRENEAGKKKAIEANFATMSMREVPGLVSPSWTEGDDQEAESPALGYVPPTQTHAPV